uniref:Uncharacterized protein n=1 Tax=Anguilla anguilla TaxID=7936 RepID=A0A0E9T9T4_ANGAN
MVLLRAGGRKDRRSYAVRSEMFTHCASHHSHHVRRIVFDRSMFTTRSFFSS